MQYVGVHSVVPLQNHQLCGVNMPPKTHIHGQKNLDSNYVVFLSSLSVEIQLKRSCCLPLNLSIVTLEPAGCLLPNWQHEKGHKNEKLLPEKKCVGGIQKSTLSPLRGKGVCDEAGNMFF